MSIVKSCLRKFRVFIGRILGDTLKKRIKDFYRKFRYRVVVPLSQWFLIRCLRRKEKINVVFIASTLPMWRYQGIYELLSKHPRFNVDVVIIPFRPYSKEQQQSDVETLKKYFDSLGIPYKVSYEVTFDIRRELTPDILFYPQPYSGVLPEQNDYFTFRYRLLCYYPYAFWTATDEWSYNDLLHNFAWKLFYSTELHRKEAIKIAYNKGRNVDVVGYPNADNFLYKVHKDVWKPQSKIKKRIIWAPHFTIVSGGLMTQSNFLWMADFMLQLTERYNQEIQFAFKPHPRLKSDLCRHKDWGKDKVDHYYDEWCTRENTQLEEGEFVELFMTSDAMIHDCGSFSVEYHYSSKPVMFVAENFEELVSEKGEFGQLAMRQHYVGKCKEDIIHFIEEVVFKGNDPMKEGRKDFYNKYLLPPNGKSVAENTMDVFLKTFC